MGDVVQNADREFWRAPIVPAAVPPPGLAETCQGCGAEFVMGAGFCHVCGTHRQEVTSAPPVTPSWTRHLEFHHIQARIGLPTISLIAFLIGAVCMIAAVLVGFFFSATTVLDWQAIQIWRIEWLLGAAGAFLAGILLKNRSQP
jgi:hypothetical protein